MTTSASAPGSSPARGSSRSRNRLLAASASVLLLIILYRSVDLGAAIAALKRGHVGWLIVSIGMIAPITILRAVRFAWTAPAGTVSGVREALRLTLVASALNTFLPAKAGDFIKSITLTRMGAAAPGVAVAIVVYERTSDLFGLLCWALGGWLLRPDLLRVLPDAVWLLFALLWATSGVLILSQRAAHLCAHLVERLLPFQRLTLVHSLARGWPELHHQLAGRRLKLAAFAIFLWLVQLVQFWLFSVALSANLSFVVCSSLSAVALMAGQLPFTFGGIGARDVALVLLLAGHVAPETAAAIGILSASRNLLPPLAALPILRPYLDLSRAQRSA